MKLSADTCPQSEACQQLVEQGGEAVCVSTKAVALAGLCTSCRRITERDSDNIHVWVVPAFEAR